MDVALGHDDALGDLDLALRADELAGAGAGDLAGLANRRGNADGAGVSQGQLHLGLRANRAEDGHAAQGLLRAHDVNALGAGVLAGLGQHLLHGQLIALAEEDVQSLAGNMHMTCRSLNKNLIRHWNALLTVFKVPLIIAKSGKNAIDDRKSASFKSAYASPCPAALPHSIPFSSRPGMHALHRPCAVISDQST